VTPPAADRPVHVLLLLRETLSGEHLERLQAVSPRLVVHQNPAQRPAEFPAKALDGVEVLYTALNIQPELAQAPALRWMHIHWAGVNRWLDWPGLQRLTLTNASGVHGVNIGEHVLMTMLALARQLPLALRAQSERRWSQDEASAAGLRELRGSTLAIVGYGSIGREVARLARAFGVRVLASKRDPSRTADLGWSLPGTGDPAGELPERYYGPGDWRAMLPEADYVLVAAPLTPGTRHLIDRAALSAMPPGAALINIARGDLVDEAALIEALQSGALGAAALDVFAQEPLPPDSPLWGLPNVLITAAAHRRVSHARLLILLRFFTCGAGSTPHAA
jgi:phosphoglycerate dehydrogenase-like enzyme